MELHGMPGVMKILMAATEMAPFARSGSLADSLHSLPEALQARGHQISVVLPLFRSVREQQDFPIEPTKVKFSVPVGPATYDCEVFQTRLPSGLQVFFLRRDEFFDRSGLYGNEGRDYEDNSARFIYFAKAVIELARRLDPSPDILHGHDWPCGMIPVLAKVRGLSLPQVLTVHDLGFQGNFWSYDFALTNLPSNYFSPGGVEFYGSLNFLKSGLVFADRVIFPSEILINEAMEPGQGCGLESLLREQRGKLVGIPEAVEPSLWDPARDPHLPANFSPDNLEGKTACRAALLTECDLDPNPSRPVFGMVTRLLRNKGFDILLPALDRLLAGDNRLVILGQGEPEYEVHLQIAARKHAGKMALLRRTDEDMARKIFAGADILLAPARLEEGGVRTMQAMRYGVIPIARASGGLRQLVEDYDPDTGAGTGFVFYDFTADALVDAVRRAEDVWQSPPAWKNLLGRAMSMDCSWDAAADRHEKLYRSLV